MHIGLVKLMHLFPDATVVVSFDLWDVYVRVVEREVVFDVVVVLEDGRVVDRDGIDVYPGTRLPEEQGLVV